MFALASLAGCASYMTPGAGVSLPEITAVTDSDIARSLATKPAAQFPARIIVARVQATGYQSASNRGYGGGKFSVLMARDIETEADFSKLGTMPGVAAVGVLSRLLLPPDLQSAQDIREAAAKLHGDIVLLYTLDTAFRTDTAQIGPLQLVSLGFFPSKKSKVTTTCAAAFLDVRTGYVYGVAEGSATEEQRSDVWGTANAIESARMKAERKAFETALTEVEKTWASIYREYGKPATAKSP
jgi:hypothetical protein